MGIMAMLGHECDSNKIRKLISTSEQKRELSEFKVADSLARAALQCAEKTGSPKNIAQAAHELGVVSFLMRNQAEASTYFTRSFQISTEKDYTDLIALNQCYLGALAGNQRKPEEALKHWDHALTFFQKTGNKKGIIKTESLIGNFYRNQAKFDDALAHYSVSLQLAEKINYVWAIATNHGLMCSVFGMRGYYKEAYDHATDALENWQKLGNKQGISDNVHVLGAIAFQQSNYADALTHYLRALRIRKEIGDSLKIGESYHDIGHIYYKQSETLQALENYKQALRLFQFSNNKERIAKAHTSLGNAYSDLKKLTNAVDEYQASIAIQTETGDRAGLVHNYNNCVSTYLLLGELDQAENYLLKAKELAIELGDKESLGRNYHNMGKLKLFKKQFVEAKDYLTEGIRLCKENGSKDFVRHGYNLLTEVEDSLGNHAAALRAHRQFKAYSDSILMAEKGQVIEELKLSYETEKKDLEIQRQQELLGRVQSDKNRIHTENLYNLKKIELLDRDKTLQQLQIEKSFAENAAQKAEADRKQDQVTLLQKEAELQAIKLKRQTMTKNYLAGGLILFALLSFFIYNYYVTRQRLKMQTLRVKIASDLHDDVGSTLSSIAIFSDIAQQQSSEVSPLLNTIGESSRQMMDAMADIVWTINPENDQFEKIILKMKSFAYELLGAKKIGFDFTADEDVNKITLSMDVRKNLFLIFKEATNNIVKYSEADMAMFSIKNHKDKLSMTIRDNGKGFDMNKQTEGNGLKNMQKRAKEIGGSLNIESRPGNGTSILFSMPV